MAGTSVEFFATASEQREWLNDVLTDPNIWALAESVTNGQFQPLSAAMLHGLSFAGREYGIRIFLGRVDLAEEPLFDTKLGRLELDFGWSRAVQFVPSMQQGETILEGTLAVLRKSEYHHLGIDEAPILKWYGALSRSLEKALANSPVRLITISPGRPSARTRRRVLVSPGAVKLWRSGKHLKQFLDSKVEFDIELTPPA